MLLYTLSTARVSGARASGGAFACPNIQTFLEGSTRSTKYGFSRNSDAVSPPQRVLSSELLWRDLATDRPQQQRVQTYTAKCTTNARRGRMGWAAAEAARVSACGSGRGPPSGPVFSSGSVELSAGPPSCQGGASVARFPMLSGSPAAAARGLAASEHGSASRPCAARAP